MHVRFIPLFVMHGRALMIYHVTIKIQQMNRFVKQTEQRVLFF